MSDDTKHTLMMVELQKLNKVAESFYVASSNQVQNSRNLEKKLDDYIRDDGEWKKRAEPAIELGIVARDASKAVLWVGGALIVIGGAIEIIIRFIKNKL